MRHKHKFNPASKSKLDNPKRRGILPVDKILSEINIQKNEKIADIGCGIGYFTFPMAGAVGNHGQVYAIDIEREMIEDVKEKINENHIKNITPILSMENDLKLEDNTVNRGFLSTVFHEVNKPEDFLKEINRILVTGGKLDIIDWVKAETDSGPPIGHRLDPEEIKKDLEKTGFKDIKVINFNEYFYIIRAIKR